MPTDRQTAIADHIVDARRRGARIALSPDDTPRDFEDGFAIQDVVVAKLGSPVMGWKVMPLPNGPVVYAPILLSGRVAAGGTWELVGDQPAGIELEIAFRIGRDVAADAAPEEIVKAIAGAHVVFELCQSRLAEPSSIPRHVGLADCIANAGLVVGPEIEGWRAMDLKARPGRLLVDGAVHAEGKSVDPIAALQVLPAALGARGKQLKAGQIVITGSLIGMNWLTGRHALRGVIDGCGEATLTLAAA